MSRRTATSLDSTVIEVSHLGGARGHRFAVRRRRVTRRLALQLPRPRAGSGLAMNAKSSHSVTMSPKVRAVPDEWSVLHPEQAGPKTAIRAVPSVNPTTVHDLREMLGSDDSDPEQALRESVQT